jgi:hypothetical protein
LKAIAAGSASSGGDVLSFIFILNVAAKTMEKEKVQAQIRV